MLIKQKRVNGLSKLSNLKEGTPIRIVVKNTDRDIMTSMGFKDHLTVGQCVLPNVIGPSSKLNAEGKCVIHRDQEKEKHYRMQEWTYKQFCGRGKTVEVTDSTYVPYERYPRTQLPPLSIEFFIDEIESTKVVSSPEFILGEDDEKIILAINIMLEYFGYSEVISNGNDFALKGELIRLNWDVLPKGKYPWEEQQERIKLFLSKAKGKNRDVIDKRLEAINELEPDFTAIGQGGFSGYVVYGFTQEGIYILESVAVNNATYVLDSNWENISKLTKAEILKNELHKKRIIHAPGWYEEIKRLLE